MRIAFIRSRYNPYGGAERFVGRAIAALDTQGATVTLIAREWIAAAASGEFDTHAPQLEVRICNPAYLGSVWRDASFARAARRILDEEKFDLVQSHERIVGCDVYRAGDGVHAEWLRQRDRVLGTAGRIGVRLNLHHRYVLRVERAMFADPRLRAVVCNSAMVREEIRSHFGVAQDRLHVIYNGVDADAFHPRLAGLHRKAVRQRLGIPQEARLYLLVGSGFERKGVPALLAAMAQIPDAHALVIGTDKHIARYRQSAGPRVLFLGGQDAVQPYYGAADAFVLPTLYDPLPNAALEALACGLPVVTSSKCGAAELMTEGVSGFVRDALDIEGIAAAMRAAADSARNPGLRAAARKVAEPLSLEAMATRLLGLYRHLLQR